MNSNQPLNEFLSLNECSGLNIQGDNGVTSVFGGGSPIECQSGDPEMIIVVKFREKVSLTQILIESGMNEEKHPAVLKLFANIDDLDFADAEAFPATETIKLEGNFGKNIKLNVPRFRNVSELCVNIQILILLLQLFFQNEEAEQIQVNNIRFLGSKGSGKVDFGEMKKNPAG